MNQENKKKKSKKHCTISRAFRTTSLYRTTEKKYKVIVNEDYLNIRLIRIKTKSFFKRWIPSDKKRFIIYFDRLYMKDFNYHMTMRIQLEKPITFKNLSIKKKK